MTKLARWCYAHRRAVVAAWVVALIVISVITGATGSNFSQSFSLPNTDSQAEVNLLKANFSAASGESDQIVISTSHGSKITSPQVESDVKAALAKVARVPGIAGVISPYAAGAGAKQISQNGTVAFATVAWAKAAQDVTKDDATNLINAAQSGQNADVAINLGGASIENQENAGPGISVAVGVIAALIVLLIVFYGGFIASLMPLLATILSLGISIEVISLLSNAIGIPSVSSDLAVLIGLGVGVDYGLFVVSRFRAGLLLGKSPEDAITTAINTSGRTVLFAGATVCIALLGQLALGVSFLNGLSVASAIAVAFTILSALTFLPAVLGMLGPRLLTRSERRGTASHPEASSFWLRWSSLLERFRFPAAAASIAVVILVAVPITQLRLGNADASTDPASETSAKAYHALAEGFGPGFNGPLQLAATVDGAGQLKAFRQVVATAARQPGVAGATPARVSPNHKAALAVLYPSTSPQAQQTVDLVNHLRDDILPPLEKRSGLDVHVGGATATNIDFSHVLTKKLPIFIALVVVLAFILLTAVFRSLVIPLVAAILNLLSIGAALGALNAVFNLGWLDGLFGVTATGPISAFLPVLMFSVLFGLSMDYEVYLVSRIQEEWHRIRRDEPSTAKADNSLAIEIGQAKSGRVIAAAASIMILVFGSFLISNQVILKEFGFGLAFSVLVDAFIIRSIFVPAIMHLLGPINWAMPRWLDRVVPNLSIEAEDDEGAVKV